MKPADAAKVMNARYIVDYCQQLAWFIFCMAISKISIMDNKQELNQSKQSQDNTSQSQQQPDDTNNSNTVKDPNEWTTGSESMTGAQKSYLKTLSDEAGEPFDENLNKAEASLKINELQQKTGRGVDR